MFITNLKTHLKHLIAAEEHLNKEITKFLHTLLIAHIDPVFDHLAISIPFCDTRNGIIIISEKNNEIENYLVYIGDLQFLEVNISAHSSSETVINYTQVMYYFDFKMICETFLKLLKTNSNETTKGGEQVSSKLLH